MKVYVISLVDAHERRAIITKTLKELNIGFEFFDAIRGDDTENKSLFGYDDKKCIKEKGRSLSLGERGCFASHRTLWLECVEKNEIFLIFEDDVFFADDFKHILLDLDQVVSEIGYVKLGHSANRKFMGLKQFVSTNYKINASKNNKYKVVRYLTSQNGSYAYAISPAAARKLVINSEEWWHPVDNYIEFEEEHGVLNLGVEPPVVFPSDAPSTIGQRRIIKKQGFISKAVVQFYRNKKTLRELIANLRYFFIRFF